MLVASNFDFLKLDTQLNELLRTAQEAEKIMPTKITKVLLVNHERFQNISLTT